MFAASPIRAEGEELGADFSSLKEYKGTNYLINYPGKGYERQLIILVGRLDKIIPFAESYGSVQLKNIIINITKSTSQLELGKNFAGEFRTEGDKIYIELPAAYYNENVVVHEICHLPQIPLLVPAWFAEGHAENCARRYYESAKEYDRAEIYKNYYGNKIQRLKNIQVEIPKWVVQEDLDQGDVGEKTGLQSYLLMDELAKAVSMAKILPKLKQDFVINENGTRKPYNELLPNDAVICKINEVASENIIPLFEKYGFKIETCNDKVYAFLTAPKVSGSVLGLATVVLGMGFWAVVIWFIVRLIKNKKKK